MQGIDAAESLDDEVFQLRGSVESLAVCMREDETAEDEEEVDKQERMTDERIVVEMSDRTQMKQRNRQRCNPASHREPQIASLHSSKRTARRFLSGWGRVWLFAEPQMHKSTHHHERYQAGRYGERRLQNAIHRPENEQEEKESAAVVGACTDAASHRGCRREPPPRKSPSRSRRDRESHPDRRNGRRGRPTGATGRRSRMRSGFQNVR